MESKHWWSDGGPYVSIVPNSIDAGWLAIGHLRVDERTTIPDKPCAYRALAFYGERQYTTYDRWYDLIAGHHRPRWKRPFSSMIHGDRKWEKMNALRGRRFIGVSDLT